MIALRALETVSYDARNTGDARRDFSTHLLLKSRVGAAAGSAMHVGTNGQPTVPPQNLDPSYLKNLLKAIQSQSVSGNSALSSLA